MSAHRYSDAEIAAVYRVIAERRDMRHFLPQAVAPEVLTRILQAAHQAPNVGLMQPWRFIRITDLDKRNSIHQLVDEERIQTAKAIGEYENTARMAEFMRLKVEGILDCGELLVATLCNNRDGHIFGRRTLPEMDLASVSCAIQNMWLAARAEGLGMGWVSIFDPIKLAALLGIPEGAKPIAILCLGHVSSFYKEPMLVETGWKQAQPLSAMMMENSWKQ
ncbi:MAG: 5,6-dimethylbenzimidazole synthase [Methylotenera sp. 24-45-7]|jgi:5,6-dimethylbenzimidazole synthase|nr:MAG: 5,6-dimethylbenzimidazole synthase [Mehylophilales bacterium 35-46-6]OYZ40415.1 MAG: 5,6-dimethylbenzimidazole synthase [Methylotenera sp. 24-45-7]OZA09366.1 MAG: 5,6-dimethylbenzimidazole synthase [Methylotenera sp. 17-45-7]OZA53653.1 MAG: 5,6-dimethylbenzimidazole synthase [Methylophilales bacterium 39-45-7]HQS37266.1 5,6-dimethylbenzimidazole synthase [Methylotenera sp.]